ncbi:prolyl oligopeptidase family serine peptidase [Hymenobacter endophyticus]|uniref:prolyl oligopeptidase n=1 Tax=Hymenobacter endophyticus TaxID=3076335 RepID=A0ABU3TGQ6_9BACT|nr:prolyl oligopeptidase family serine peptidase [Hymenobacter endophyticus]MDU0370548.1 prolyl oligopeptidase family serine peptidase [Hymenobacter endophyticus]
MKTAFLFLMLPELLAAPVALAQTTSAGPPATPQRPVTDVYFGKKVVDNYRWLEDVNSPEVKTCFQAQADYTKRTLDQLPGRDSLIKTFEAYDKLLTVRYGQVKKRGSRYFYRKTLPSETVGKLYVREGKTGPEKLLFDPTAYDKTKTYSMTAYTPSPDGQQVALGLQEGGAELSTVRVLNVATRAFRPESISAVFGGDISWLPDGSGFLYTPNNSTDPKDPKGNLDTKARLHRLGTAVATDRELWSRAKNPDMGMRPDQYPIMAFTNDQTLVYGVLASVDRRADVWLTTPADLAKPIIAWKHLVTPTDSVYDFAKLGSNIYLHSVKGAPKGRILVTDAARPSPANATVLLPEGTGNITRLLATKDYVFVVLSDGINEKVRQYDPRTQQWANVPMPGTGTAGLEPYNATTSNEIFTYVSTWSRPETVYDYTPESRKMVVSPFDMQARYPGTDDLVVEELEVPGHDGVLVPLSLIYKKGLRKDGNAVCFMTGYAAYGISATPYFSRRNLALLNQGVILAETHPRGGSEKGQAWYRAGYQTTKPNTWKDFISCGEYLVKNKYTSPQHLIGEGTSAGGILIGRAITERPDLFAAAISNVSCSNALRMENSPNGPVNTPEFGTVKDSVQCMGLYEMDAFQHVKPGTKYPAVLCVGGMNDPRVIVWQPGKFAAALQAASTSGKPVLLQVNYDNGHFTEDKKVTFRNFANMYAFALWQAGHPNFQPKSVAAK